jgi:hypothetical protein
VQADFCWPSDEAVIFEGVVMKLEMTNCISCSCEMPMGATICPSCGKEQIQSARRAPVTPRTLLAVALSAAVLLIFNWIKSPAPPVSQITSPPSAALPSR